MSTASIDLAPRPAKTRVVVQSEPVTLSRVMKSEWIKFRSLRSSWAMLAGAMAGMLLIGLIVAFNTRHLTGNQDANDLAPSATLQGYFLGQLLIGALGVLFVSSEFSTGMIYSTFAAVPKRIPVLWAKVVVFFTVTAVSMVTMTVIAFVAAQAVIGQARPGYSLSDPGVWRVVLGTGLYLTLVGVIGGMIGWIVRSTPGALVTYFALMLVLPVLGELFGPSGLRLTQYLPGPAGSAFTTSVSDAPHLSPGVGLVVLCAWVVAGVVVATLSLRRRDA